MTTSTLSVIEEFLRYSDGKLRRNALSALRALAWPKTVPTILDKAIGDPEEPVRRHAESVLQSLEPEVLASAAEPLSAALASPDRRRSAYALLGRLRAGGKVVRVEVPWLRRVGLVRSLTVFGSGMQALSWRWHLVARGLIGAFFGLAAAGLYLLGAFGRETLQALGTLALVALLLSPVLVLAVTWRSQPLALQYYRGTAAVMELVRGFFACLALTFVGVLYLLWEETPDAIPLFAGLGIAIGMAVVGVRVGTMLAYGVSPRPQLNSILQTSIGALLGIAVSAAAISLLAGIAGEPELQVVWLFSIPGLVGAAHAYAAVDALAPSAEPLATRRGAAVAAAMGVVVLLGMGWAGLRLAIARGRAPDILAPTSLPDYRRVTRLPVRVDFRAGNRGANVLVLLRSTDRYILHTMKPRLQAASGKELRPFRSPDFSYSAEFGSVRSGATWAYELTLDSVYRLEIATERGVPSEEILGRLLSTFTPGVDSSRRTTDSISDTLDLYVSLDTLGTRGRFSQQLTPAAPLRVSEDSIREATRLAGIGRFELRLGQVEDALIAFRRARELADTVALTPDDWNEVCWGGSIQEQLMDVQEACDRALDRDPDDPNYRDSRAVFRARVGDFQGAIRDLRVFIKADTSGNVTAEEQEQRRGWVTSLERDSNPFTPEVLRELRAERSPSP